MVRIAADREKVRTARISLAGALGVGLVAVLAWVYMREPPPPSVPRRTLPDFQVLWRCASDASHQFTASGRYEPRRCPQCDGPCYILLRYVCPDHGGFDVSVEFKRDPIDGAVSDARPREVITRYRHNNKSEWIESADGAVACPVTGCKARPRRPQLTWSERLKNRNAADKSSGGHNSGP